MKKLILSITAITLLTINAKAQTPDFGFESWATVYPPLAPQDPVGWASLNVLNAVTSTPLSVAKETSAPAAGTISAQVTTVRVSGASIPNPNRPGKNLDTAGILVVGKVQATPSAKLIYGYTLPAAFPRPSTLSFQSKYTPTGSDSAFVVAFLTHWNGTKRDTIASGKYATGATTTSYSINSFTMNYKPAFSNVMPDSEQIFISSSIYSHGGAQIGSAFYVDDLAWSGYTSVNEIAGVENNVSVFPNPTNDQINFNSSVNVNVVEITDITGRLTGAYKMTDNKLTIQTSSFVPGTYFYTLLNDKKEVMNRGKFEVTK
jgi:hypothetical protein